ICGGVIPDKDIPALKELKVKEVFKPMTPIEHCIGYIKILAREKGLQSLARADEEREKFIDTKSGKRRETK
ncbi:MAG: hypothetical protein Q7J12_07220, partial [Syntrophales bacterium]|nr:hypothetical protein [Syntrophales bacterium]